MSGVKDKLYKALAVLQIISMSLLQEEFSVFFILQFFLTTCT